ncbi:MAG: NAD-dependent DNA ligase LigA [Mycoplasmataceae bacterium]|nr:NAD-dependent DNA ligase LigA [Mycoplasmataceae bacterium]
MKPNQALFLINELKANINKWNHEYYVLNKPTVDDLVFDDNLKELIFLEEKFPQFVTNDSPTIQVGGAFSSSFSKMDHPVKSMLSLKNAFDFKDLADFDKQIKKILETKEDITYSVEPKIDGVSISLHYKNNKLSTALTRGDGITGEIVTKNIMQINDVKKTILINDEINLRGEIFMPINVFDKLNHQRLSNDEKMLANPRNAASGAIRQLNPLVTKDRKLAIFIYFALNTKTKKDYWDSQIETLDNLKKDGFPVIQNYVKATSIQMVMKEINKIIDLKSTLDYEIDGVVIKVNDNKLHDQIGYTTKFPKWAIAYKFPAEIKETKLLDIFPTVGRTGRITYNAKLKPINLVGTTVQKATLHNADYIKDLDLRIGDIVKVKKAGEIIPKVIGVNLNKRDKGLIKWNEPTQCPSCRTKLIQTENEVDKYCPNSKCFSRIDEGLIHFASRQAMNIEGLSDKQIISFRELNLIKEIPDIYRLVEKKDELLLLKGYKEKSVNKLLNAIDLSKKNSLSQLLFGLGIRHIGYKSSKDLANRYLNIDDLIKITYEKFLTDVDFGDVKATSVVAYFNDEKNIKMINELKSLGLNMKESKLIIDDNSFFFNKKILLTGTFSDVNRDEAKQFFQTLGANIVTSVSKNTDFIIAGTKPSTIKLSKIEPSKIIRVYNLKELKNYEQ